MPRIGENAQMDDSNKNPFNLLLDGIRQIIKEEIAANSMDSRSQADRLLTPEEAASILGQNVRWLYRHAATLPFTRRISRKNLRFSETGLRRWLAAKKPDFRR